MVVLKHWRQLLMNPAQTVQLLRSLWRLAESRGFIPIMKKPVEHSRQKVLLLQKRQFTIWELQEAHLPFVVR